MLVAQLLALVDRLAPAALAEDWDNVGLIVGRHNRPVRRVLVALELRDEVLHEARERGCDTVLTHHPTIFPALAAVTDGAPAAELVLSAAESRTTVVAAHTNLDACHGGLNDQLAEMLGLSGTRPLRPHPARAGEGLGRIGRAGPGPLEALVRRLEAALEGARVDYVGDPGARVELVACCTGSGASLIPDARAAEVDVYVTGDLTYHDADRAQGMPLVLAPHAATERIALRRWFRTLERALAREGAEALFAEADTDPWHRAGGGRPAGGAR
ncbi:MAG TPA: Nif3-like dinuclear metal center hexameric protein [Miltoncostaeaceae bacterium]|nr:Nif3-like dinuclear metal center hexameric protein [Miltoncostaeaceae bacterium]